MVMLKNAEDPEVENLVKRLLTVQVSFFLVNGSVLWLIFKCFLFQHLSQHCTLTRIWNMFILS